MIVTFESVDEILKWAQIKTTKHYFPMVGYTDRFSKFYGISPRFELSWAL